MIKTAIIGFGYSAQTFHVPLLQAHSGFSIVAVSSSKAAMVNAALPEASCYDNVESILQDETIDLVVITSPNDTHFPIAKAALERGKHVVLEKPFVNSVTEGEALIELAEKRQCILSVFHNRRWDGDFLTVKSLIDEGAFGSVRFFESHFDRFRPKVRDRWREQPGPGAGTWYDLGSHLVDQAFSLFGKPERISSSCRCLRENSKTVDFFHVLLHYPDLEVVLQSSPFSAAETLRFNVQGELGNYVKYGLDPQEMALKSGVIPMSESWFESLQTPDGKLHTDAGVREIVTLAGNYSAYFDGVAAAINQGEALDVTARQALDVIELIESVEREMRVAGG